MLTLSLVGMCMASCIQDEPLNAEADILQCNLSSDKEYLVTASDTLMEVTSIMNNITIFVKPGCDLSKRAPRFILTEGATIEPASGSVQDFSNNKTVKYTVTSQSGEWKREYTVAYYTFISLPTHFGFEHYQLNESNKYHIIYEEVDGVDVMSWWNSGNPGFCLASSAGPDGYPTVCIEEGYKGRCVKLTTRYAYRARKPFCGNIQCATSLESTFGCHTVRYTICRGAGFHRGLLQVYPWSSDDGR